MTYGWARQMALKLINLYTVSGEQPSPGYNHYADYLNKIPTLVEDAQVYIATAGRPIGAVKPLSELDSEVVGGVRLYALPEDCWKVTGAGLLLLAGGEMERFADYYQLPDKRLALLKIPPGILYLEYFRLPRPLGENPLEADLLDNAVEAQMAVPYYVAARLVLYEDSFLYSALNREFEEKLRRLRGSPLAEVGAARDVYSGGGGDGA